MQILSAPNRAELDRAHRNRIWLHIGVPSLSNLKHIGRDRVLLWRLLFLTSIPLHLLFNSVVFTNLQANIYHVIPTMATWLQGQPYNSSGFLDPFTNGSIEDIMEPYRVDFSDIVTLRDESTMVKYKNTNTSECFSKYNGQYISEVGNVYLIQKSATAWRDPSLWKIERDKQTSNFTWLRAKDAYAVEGVVDFSLPFKSSPDVYPSNDWRCRSHTSNCDVNNPFEVPQNRSLWAPYESVVDYCIVEQVEEVCKLQFSFPIAIVVIVANFTKAVCMLLTLLKYRSHEALATIGDAVASFLDHADPETTGRCLWTGRAMDNKWIVDPKVGEHEEVHDPRPARYKPRARKWGSAPSAERWVWTYVA